MDGFHYVDIFATKGIEYLVVIAFLIAIIFFWQYLNETVVEPEGDTGTGHGGGSGCFTLAKNLYYHQGHTWASPEGEDTVKLGIDDFAQKFLGRPQMLVLPEPGFSLQQGDRAWTVQVGSHSIDMLSPVTGEVVAVNEEVVRSPEIIQKDPYGSGWLVKVKAPNLKTNLSNLLAGNIARSWMEQQVGMVLRAGAEDASELAPGFGKKLWQEQWTKIAREFFQPGR